MTKAKRIFELAQEGADAYQMYKARRAGAGTPYTDEVINQFLSKESRQSVDFWLGDEQTIMEMEFSAFSSPPVLEKEVFKALLAKDAGNDVRHLILIGDPGSGLLSQAPTPAAIMNWVERRHQIRVHIWELKDRDKP